MKRPELLSPAGSLSHMRFAYAYGADAVYAGQPRYSLRVRNNEFSKEAVLDKGIEEAHAMGKLERKNLDLIVLNSLKDAGAGFGHDTNKVTLIEKGTKAVAIPLMSKAATARAILDHLETII